MLGGTVAKIVNGCACQTLEIQLSLYQFFAQLPTRQYTIFGRKAPNLGKIEWVFFTMIYSKCTKFLSLGSIVYDENSLIALPNFVIKHLKNAGTYYTYTMSMREPPE